MSDRSVPFDLPTRKSGKIILVATATAKPGQADKVQAMLADVRKMAESDKESDTHTYRTTRAAEGDRDTFVVFEEYTLPDGIVDHVHNPPFQALAKADLLSSLDIKYYEEFDGENTVLSK